MSFDNEPTASIYSCSSIICGVKKVMSAKNCTTTFSANLVPSPAGYSSGMTFSETIYLSPKRHTSATRLVYGNGIQLGPSYGEAIRCLPQRYSESIVVPTPVEIGLTHKIQIKSP